MNFFTKVSARPAETDAESAGQRRLGIAGIRTQVVGVIAPNYPQRARRIWAYRGGCDHHEQSGEPRRDKIHHVVQARGEFAEVEMSFSAVADHGIQRADGFISHG